MKSPVLIARTLTLACAVALSSAFAWSPDTQAEPVPGTSVFRAETDAAGGVRAARGASSARFAAPAAGDPFSTGLEHGSRPIAAQPASGTRPGRAQDWQPNRITLGDGGPDSLGRTLPEHETRLRDWEAYRQQHERPAAPNPYDPSMQQAETRSFYDNGSGSRCITSLSPDVARTSCNVR
ncbi:hypothetical protein [Burkholderia guangdongensis]|uniref:hypothetical protein n=1 Tax=Burkholderia guangdongensis TaxID=1792500 RepID=UPI0015CBF73D|nr:hypothetical protein [Burkholderia guangdongensis]